MKIYFEPKVVKVQLECNLCDVFGGPSGGGDQNMGAPMRHGVDW